MHRLSKLQLAALNTARHAEVTLAVKPAENAPAAQEVTQTSKIQEKDFLGALRAIMMDDHTYAGVYEASSDLPDGLLRVNCRLFDAGRRELPLDVEFYPDHQKLCLVSPAVPGYSFRSREIINYSHSEPRVLALLKRAFPNAPSIQALTPKPLSTPAVSPLIPADVLKRTATLHPGMTRADLLKVYKEMGGFFDTYHHIYYMGGLTIPEQGTYEEVENGVKVRKATTLHAIIRIDAWFAPRNARLRWIDGLGIPIDFQEMYRMGGGEKSDDIIVKLSAPYLGGFIGD